MEQINILSAEELTKKQEDIHYTNADKQLEYVMQLMQKHILTSTEKHIVYNSKLLPPVVDKLKKLGYRISNVTTDKTLIYW